MGHPLFMRRKYWENINFVDWWKCSHFDGPFDKLVVLFFLIMLFRPALGKSVLELKGFLDLNMIGLYSLVLSDT